MGADRVRAFLRQGGILADLKWIFPKAKTDVRL